jgi:hypothetical protein
LFALGFAAKREKIISEWGEHSVADDSSVRRPPFLSFLHQALRRARQFPVERALFALPLLFPAAMAIFNK